MNWKKKNIQNSFLNFTSRASKCSKCFCYMWHGPANWRKPLPAPIKT